MKYCVLFPQAKNVHLIKDVGMIAYKLNKLYSCESYVACYNNDKYDYIDGHLKGLKLDFIDKKRNNDIIDGSIYLKKNAKSIDVLQLFHVTIRSVIYAIVYKRYNKKGKIFLKLDCTEELLNKIKNLNFAGKLLFNYFFKKVDFIGVEQKSLFNEIKSLLPKFENKFIYIPNGIDYDLIHLDDLTCENKKNYILHVGRLGAEEKNSEMIVDAFVKLYKEDNSMPWTLVLAGDSTPKFNDFIRNYTDQYAGLSEKIMLLGQLSDREELFNIYSKSKIFCLTSHFESFGIVLIEAAAVGNIIVSTDVGIAKELTEQGGAIVQDSDIDDLASKLLNFIKDKNSKNICKHNIDFVRENYDWDKIVMRLYRAITRY